MSLIKYDEKVARGLYEQLNCTGITENAVFPKEKEKRNYRPRTLVDETLEYIDPTPNIYTLFVQFNEKFFWNVLLPVQVKWSPRMTSCAGVCSFHPRNRECVISLSTPLLKLRPRKDLIETLLHEMIHAYLFLTNDNRDRDGHGPVFQSHMKRINSQAGTNITIYHDFHDEVKLYQQHWWRCNGPCQKRAPYFGTVRRAMNRAPGKNDFWWAEHQATCGGQFIKIKEPEKPVKKANASKSRVSTGGVPKSPQKSILSWVTKTDNSPIKNVPGKSNASQITNWSNKSTSQTTNWGTKNTSQITNSNHTKNTGTASNNLKKPSQSQVTGLSNITNSNHTKNTGTASNNLKKPSQSQVTGLSNNISKAVSNFQTDLKKLENSTNNVHGWGTGGPDSSTSSNSSSANNKTSSSSSNSAGPKLCFSGTLGGIGTGRSNLLDKFNSTETKNKAPRNSSTIRAKPTNSNSFSKNIIKPSLSNSPEKIVKVTVNCPNCNKCIEESKINDHLDLCLANIDDWSEDLEVIPDESNRKRKCEDNCSTPNKIFKEENATSSKELKCPLCQKKLKPDAFNDHLENCLQTSFDEGVTNNDDNNDDVVLVRDSSFSSNNLCDSLQRCLVCDQEIKPGTTLDEHLENCLQKSFDEESDNDKDDVVLIQDTSSGSVNLHDSPHQCLICDQVIKPGMTLNEHLEECVASVFNDSTDTDEGIEKSMTVDTQKTEEKQSLDDYPCPICMSLVKQSLMNDHLDTCLAKAE